MKISKKDALSWMQFFTMLDEEDTLLPKQQEILFSILAQIERARNKRIDELKKEIPELKNLAKRSIYVGRDDKFPQGCKSCLTGTGLGAIRKTNKCNIECKFCYNYGELDSIEPVGEGMFEIGGTKFYEDDIETLLEISKKPTGVAYVYLEPFMEIEKYYKIISIFSSHGIYQHMYTNGLLVTEESLKELARAGLDELRFNLGASNASDKVIEMMKTAKKYIPKVGIETPMTREFFEQFQNKKDKILDTGLDFINCAELHLNPNNIANYLGENMYCSRQGYVSPIFSRELTLKLMKQAVEENFDIVVHDCSNDTKFYRDINLSMREGKWFGASGYGSEFGIFPYEAFLSVLEDDSFEFLEEEPMPAGFRAGDLIL